jgi:glycosyltransferase involved in cell wall biosynthesis
MLSSLESERNLEIAKIGLEGADKIISNSKFTKKGLVNDFDIPKNKIKVIYPGVDTKIFKPVTSRVKNALKRKYKCQGKRIVFSSGYFAEEKGFQYLLKAAGMYEKKHDDIVTIITGQGPYQPEMEKLIKKYKLKNTKILGWVLKKDLVRLYASADVFITPSIWEEPFGMVSVEALSSRTPVIASNMGGIPEIVTKDVGDTVQSKSASALSSAIQNRIYDDSWLNKTGKRGRQKVIEYFSEKVGGRETEKLYKRAVK